jgi:pimeloyl-ACP methyl ester carboxylesterase
MPAAEAWNGDLVLYAHGYVAYNEPIAIPEDQLVLPNGASIPQIVNDLGFAFATTSYAVNGLAVTQGIDDLVDLVHIFGDTYGQPTRVYLVGASEGGAVTALSIERHADTFSGGLATCGPIGNFQSQINYWGDVRTLFDYFFPDVLPGSPITIPQEVIDNWDGIYSKSVEAALRANPQQMNQLLRVAGIPSHPTDLDATIAGLVDVLWYNVFATNDGVAKLGGQPYDNTQRLYRGSTDDELLNTTIPRFRADAAAMQAIDSNYQTHGDIGAPLVTLHTTGDPIVPYWHEPIYKAKIVAAGAGEPHINIPVARRYGHCNFSAAQALVSLVLLVREVTGSPILNAERALLTAAERMEYRELAAAYDLPAGDLYRTYLPILRR